MIFVCIGSRDYQFNRLLKALDELVASGEITDDIFAQIGQSEYVPQHYRWERYLDSAVMAKLKTVTIIHGKGTGALRQAVWTFLKKDNRVSSYRAGQYGEGDFGVTVVELK